MKFNMILKDYNIHSIKIYRITLLTFSIIMFSMLLAEIFIDLGATSLEILLPITIFSIISFFFSYLFPESKILRSSVSLIIFIAMEGHFLINPKMYHVIIYWYPFVPLIALIIQGIRVSQLWLLIVIVTHIFNAYYLKEIVGESYDLVVYRWPFFISSLIFLVGILTTSLLLYSLMGDAFNHMKLKNVELEDLKSRIEEKKNLLEQYQQNIIRLSKTESAFNQGQEHLFKTLCKTAVNTLKVSRISIWLFENNNQIIARKYLYEVENESDEKIILNRHDYHNYFDAIETQPYIMASDARKHSETRDFTKDYLLPLDIRSMLDCPIIVDRKPIGVICCEHKHEMRQWNSEDLLFIQSLTDFIATSYKNERIKTLLQEIKQNNEVLSDQNNKIEALNTELSVWNENLEETVRKRTVELETQNAQLTEYAFINSHLLREPLSRILGLSTMLSQEATSIRDIELLQALTSSTNEMDSIIRKITEILKEGHHLTREDIKAIIERDFS